MKWNKSKFKVYTRKRVKIDWKISLLKAWDTMRNAMLTRKLKINWIRVKKGTKKKNYFFLVPKELWSGISGTFLCFPQIYSIYAFLCVRFQINTKRDSILFFVPPNQTFDFFHFEIQTKMYRIKLLSGILFFLFKNSKFFPLTKTWKLSIRDQNEQGSKFIHIPNLWAS